MGLNGVVLSPTEKIRMHTADTVVNLRRCQAIIILPTPVSLPLSFNPETRIRTAETPPQASEIISFLLGCTLDLPTPKRTPHDQAQDFGKPTLAHGLGHVLVHKFQNRKDHRTPLQEPPRHPGRSLLVRV